MQYLRAFALIFMVMVSGCQENLDNLMVNSGSIEANIDSIGSFNREYNPNLQLVILLEPDYGKAVCREIDPSLREENFETWPYGTHSDTVFRSVYERYKDQPHENWPIICIPAANFEAINNLLTNDSRYDSLAVVMPYVKNAWYTNTLNFPAGKVFNQVLVGAGGNGTNDWTNGNKLDFVDTVAIQYVNPVPQYSYQIDSIADVPGGYTRIWTSLANHANLGTQVWLSIVGSSTTIYSRFCVVQWGTGYIDIYRLNVNVGQFQSGSGKQNYLSGAVFSIAAKLNGLMRQKKLSFKKVVEFAKETASNNNKRNNLTGFGYINFVPDIYGSR